MTKIEKFEKILQELKKHLMRMLIAILIVIALCVFGMWLTAQYSENHYEGIITELKQEQDSINSARAAHVGALITKHDSLTTMLCEMNSELENENDGLKQRIVRLQKDSIATNGILDRQENNIIELIEEADSLWTLAGNRDACLKNERFMNDCLSTENLALNKSLQVEEKKSQTLEWEIEDYKKAWKMTEETFNAIWNKKPRWYRFLGISYIGNANAGGIDRTTKGERKFPD
jgi:uncharacterized protein YlxW (UPF0749 family)